MGETSQELPNNLDLNPVRLGQIILDYEAQIHGVDPEDYTPEQQEVARILNLIGFMLYGLNGDDQFGPTVAGIEKQLKEKRTGFF